MSVDVWWTRDGECIPVTSMADDHLVNALAYFQRAPERMWRGWTNQYWRAMLVRELYRRNGQQAAVSDQARADCERDAVLDESDGARQDWGDWPGW